MDFTGGIEGYLGRLKVVLDAMDRKEIDAFLNALLEAHQKGANIFIMGNGGSASTASHFACDINKGVSLGMEKRFKVIALTDNMATILAYGNDEGYESIFVEQMRNFVRPGDLVIGISGSGNSKNVLRAIEHANAVGCVTVGITGYGGGKLRQMAKLSVNANVMDMQLSEDVHMVLVHMAMQLLKAALNPADGAKC